MAVGMGIEIPKKVMKIWIEFLPLEKSSVS